VTVLHADVESRGDDTFGSLQGGRLRLRGTIRVGIHTETDDDPLQTLSWDVLDKTATEGRDYRKNSVYVLPVTASKLYGWNLARMEVFCLLLEKIKNASHDYVRVGAFIIYDEKGSETYRKYKWVFDYARATPFSIASDIITIY
jgi:hypothetical protein